MEFRWVAFMALWTMLSGPIFGAPGDRVKQPTERIGVPRQLAEKPPFDQSVAAPETGKERGR